MGLDITCYKARNHEVFKHDDWYDNQEVQEVFYFRKHWDMLNSLSFININKDCGEFIQLTKDQLEEILTAATHNRDYFGGFTGVPAVCEALDNFDEDEENGWHYYFEFDY